MLSDTVSLYVVGVTVKGTRLTTRGRSCRLRPALPQGQREHLCRPSVPLALGSLLAKRFRGARAERALCKHSYPAR